jgi:TrmH family RNA methyltransferase
MTFIKPVTSIQNPTLKAIRALDQRKTRKETGRFVVEGLKVIGTAKECGWLPKVIVYEEGTAERGHARQLVDWALEKGAEVLCVPYDIMGRLSSRDNPQPMMGVFEQRWRDKPHTDGLWVVLEDVRDPGNLGTIIRTADAAGAKGLILVGTCCDPYSIEGVRATMGSIFAVPIARMEQKAFMNWCGEWPGQIIATHLQAKEDYRREYGAGPHLLLLGSEGPGLSEELTRLATMRVKIPMLGQADSLNLSVAAALMIYEIAVKA